MFVNASGNPNTFNLTGHPSPAKLHAVSTSRVADILLNEGEIDVLLIYSYEELLAPVVLF